MEVKAGYKKTEIGVIPVDWNLITFNKAFYFLTTASYSRAQLSETGNIYYVHYGDIHTKLEHFLDFEKIELPFIKKEQLRNYNLLKEGDLIMADASEDYEGIGKSVEIKNIDNKKAISGLHTFLLRGKEGVFTNGFKGYIRSNRFVKSQLDKLATGLKVYGVSKENLKTIQIPLPPLPEQKAIAEVLSDTDNLIQALEKRIAKKCLIKQGVMQKLLTSKDGWEVKKLGEICNYQNGTSLEKYFNNKEGLKVISIGNYSSNGKFIENKTFINRKYKSIISKFILEKDELTMILNDKTSVGSIIGRVLLIDKNNEYVFNQRTMRLKPKDNILSLFLYYTINSDLIHKKIVQLAKPGTQIYVNTDDITQLEISFPKSKTEQTRIATILSDMDSEIETLEKKLTKYKQLKQGLMQNLLTGKIRLL